MIGSAVRRLDGWAVVLVFLLISAFMIISPMLIMPSPAGISVAIFTALVIAGSLYEVRRKEKLGLPKLRDPFQFTAPIQILSRLTWRFVRIGTSRLRGRVVDPDSLETPPRVWCAVRDAYAQHLPLRTGIAIGMAALVTLIPLLMKPSSGHITLGLVSFAVSAAHMLEIHRRTKLGLPQGHALLMFIAPVRIVFRMIAHVARCLSRGRHTIRIVRPPLFRLDALARFLWSEKIYTRVFRAHQLEIIYEWSEAEQKGAQRRAKYIRYVGGPLSMLWHMLMQIPSSAVDLVFRAIK